jgi:hypothetical protein
VLAATILANTRTVPTNPYLLLGTRDEQLVGHAGASLSAENPLQQDSPRDGPGCPLPGVAHAGTRCNPPGMNGPEDRVLTVAEVL